MKKITAGIFAHVDAGKTTLAEGLLYLGGSIRTMGRVDKRDTYLDNDSLERERGITIFSKQAILSYENTEIILLDTPGHVDFSAETERTMRVLDYAVLVISASSGVQSHTKTLWELLRNYGVPVFIFVNKMDQAGTDKEAILKEINCELTGEGLEFNAAYDDIMSTGEPASGNVDKVYISYLESIASLDEEAMEYFLENENLPKCMISDLIKDRKLFPIYFGSALRMTGVEDLLRGINTYAIDRVMLTKRMASQGVQPENNMTEGKSENNSFSARIYKITKDEKGGRLTHMRIMSGSLKVKDLIGEEKVNRIRIYSGEKYESVNEAFAGDICTVEGLSEVYAGESIGVDSEDSMPIIEPVLSYALKLPQGVDPAFFLPKLRELEEELPELKVDYKAGIKEICVRVMGEVQLEVLTRLIKDRYNTEVSFGIGNIVYKETIAAPSYGVGHFEPLRHYAEVHLLLEPLPEGKGMEFASDVSEDILAKNWQRLIMQHLKEKTHKGVLTRSAITDIKITIINGRAHNKHTEGGDFRQATYRAVRQGLMEAENVLLEPYYAFRLEVPDGSVGRALNDMDIFGATFEIGESRNGKTVITGRGAVSVMQNYQKEVLSYTRGEGRIFLNVSGYSVCHNTAEVLENTAYDADSDLRNPSGSVFCEGGSGVTVPWDEVKDRMHCETVKWAADLSGEETEGGDEGFTYEPMPSVMDEWISTEEVDEILASVSYANAGSKSKSHKGIKVRKNKVMSTITTGGYRKSSSENSSENLLEKYILIDGYNVIFAWEDLKELSERTVDGARDSLLDMLCNYQGLTGANIIAVFDAYRVKGHQTEVLKYNNINVVYTKEAETADQYIEKFAHAHGKKYDVTVVTSDFLEQIIIRGEGCRLISAREFRPVMEEANKAALEKYSAKNKN